jgi:hypothetical protein
VENFIVRGCKARAIEVNFSDATTATSPVSDAAAVRLNNLTFIANTGDLGAALWVGPNVSVQLRTCAVSSNTATDSIIYAAGGSTLELVNCDLSSNQGTAVAFNGSTLLIRFSRFLNNSASTAALQRRVQGLGRLLWAPARRPGSTSASQVADMVVLENPSLTQLGQTADAGAIRVTQWANWSKCDLNVSQSVFQNNSGGAGGAVFLGSRAAASFSGCNFTGNVAKWLGGGAIFAYRDSCLQMTDSMLTANTVQPPQRSVTYPTLRCDRTNTVLCHKSAWPKCPNY